MTDAVESQLMPVVEPGIERSTSSADETAVRRAVAAVDRAGARLADVVLAVALIGDLAVIFGNVVARSIFHTSFIWVNEISQLALVTMTFIGGAMAYHRGLIPSVQVLTNRLSPGARAIQTALADWIVAGTAATAFALSIPHLREQWPLRSQTLQISLGWTELALASGMALLIVFALARLVRHSVRTVVATGGALALVVAALASTRGVWAPDSGETMLALIVVAGAVLLAGGVPIAFVLTFASFAYLAVPGELPLVTFVTNLEAAVQNFLLLAVPFFILAGLIMDAGGISTRIVEFARTLVGHIRGGLLQVQVVTMYLFSGVSGSESADISAVGSSMANSMRRNRYPPGETAAVLASSASMGITVPPSIAALVLASVSSISIGALFAAGLLPAAVLGVLLMIVIWVRARRLDLPALERGTLAEIASSGVRVIPGMGMMVILLGGILAGIATPTEVSTFGVVYGLALALLVYRTLTLRSLWEAITQTTALVGMVLLLISAAHGFAWMLTVNQIPQQLGDAITHIPGGSFPFLVLSIALVMVLGSLFEGIPALLILAPILLPTALELGIDPVHYGVILIFSMGIGAFSPPIGVGFLLACAVSGATVEQGIRPYVAYFATLVAGTLLVAFVPWITLVVPRLLGA